jgi:SH3-like domain-containing protein
MHVDGKCRAGLVAGVLASLLGTGPAAAGGVDSSTEPAGMTASGLPVPRFVSLKADRVNLRTGPGTEYPTTWVFRRAGLPLEVVSEFEAWRQVRDSEGTTGWVLQSFLSGRRTALVVPWEVKPEKPPPQVPIRMSDSEGTRPVALVEAGVIANVHGCDGRWCSVSIGDYRGYLPQKDLWGIYEGEIVK